MLRGRVGISCEHKLCGTQKLAICDGGQAHHLQLKEVCGARLPPTLGEQTEGGMSEREEGREGGREGGREEGGGPQAGSVAAASLPGGTDGNAGYPVMGRIGIGAGAAPPGETSAPRPAPRAPRASPGRHDPRGHPWTYFAQA